MTASSLEFTLRNSLEQMAELFGEQPEDYQLLDQLTARVEFADTLPFDVNLRKIQDICFDLIERAYQPYCSKAEDGEAPARQWVQRFRQLGEKLQLRVD